MASLQQFCAVIDIQLDTGPDMIDITEKLAACVARSHIIDGAVSAFIVGSTGSLTTIEHEPGAVTDLKAAINRLAPPDSPYAHELAWHDGNGHSHVQAALLGPSICLPIRSGKLKLGAWQQVIAINHDNRPRNRCIEVTVVGVV